MGNANYSNKYHFLKFIKLTKIKTNKKYPYFAGRNATAKTFGGCNLQIPTKN